MPFKQKSSNKPNSYVLKNIVSKYANGMPLTCDESHFLDWHQKSLSNSLFDSAASYYHKHLSHPYCEDHSFLLRHEIMNKESIGKLKSRLQILLSEKNNNIKIKFSPEQFHDFKNLNYSELILFHGNQFLTGAPFFPGGIPHIIFFQWGNLFGVAKYVVLPEERALRSNVLIYFEDMQERLLDECVQDYKNHFPEEFKHTLQPTKQASEPTSTYSTPALSLSKNKENKDKE